MAQTIKIKRSSTSGNKLTSSNSVAGELGLNTADKALYIQTGSSNGDVVTVAHESTLKIDEANNRVGIGTTSPADRLHISGGHLLLNNAIEIRSKDTGGTVRTIMRVDSSDRLQYGWSGNGAVAFMGGGSYTERMRIHTNGNIGIGTTTPSSLLTVEGDIRQTDGDLLYQGGGNWDIKHLADNQNILFYTSQSGSATEKMRIRADGKIGIGTGSPSELLHVVGTDGAIAIDASGASNTASLKFINDNERSRITSNYGSGGGGQLGFWTDTTGGTLVQRMTITNAGNVGIGTTSPLSPLSVQADSGAGVARFIGRSSDNISSLGFYNNAQSADIYLQSNGSWFRARSDGGFHWRKGGTPVVTDTDGFTINGLNVGIGTTSPSTALHVDSVSDFPAITIARSTTASGLSFTLGMSDFGGGGTDLLFDGVGASTGFGFRPRNSSGSQVNGLIIAPSGNVGIGVTTPDKMFVVQGAGAEVVISDTDTTDTPRLRFRESGTTSGTIHTDATHMIFSAGGTSERMRINPSGYVGIGTTAPTARLHISGNSDVSDEDCMLIIDDVDGSAGSRIPAIMFRSNTGGTVTNQARIRGTDTHGIVMSGSSALGTDLTVRADGVGIGTNSPGADLDIHGATASASPTIRITGTGNASQGDVIGQIEFYNSDDTDLTPGVMGKIRAIAGPSGGEGSLQILTNMPSEGTAANDIAVEFTAAGAVKISDAYTLPTADGSANQVLKTDGSGNITFGSVSAGAASSLVDADGDTQIQVEESSDEDIIRFDTAGSQRMLINSSGNVGINSASPAKTLTVGGTFQATGEAFFSHFDNITSNSRMRDDLRLNFGTARTFAIAGNSNNMHMKNGTTDVMTFDTSNRVGIGTTSPVAPLTIKSNSVSSGNSGLRIDANGSTDPIALIGEKSTNGGRFHLYDGGVEKIAFYTDGTANHISAGNVGIGTSSPDSLLHLKSTGDTRMTIESPDDNDAYINFSGASNEMSLGFDKSDSAMYITNHGTITANRRVTIKTSGNVGIGTTAPTHQLHVAGAGDIVIEDTGGGSAHLRLKSSASGTETSHWKLKTNAANHFYIDNDQQGTNPFTILSGGDVGIGTTSPGSILDIVAGTSDSDPAILRLRSGTEANTGIGDVYAGIEMGVVGAENSTGDLTNGVTVAIKAIDTRSGETSFEDAGLGFYTTDGSDSAPVLRAVVTDDGGLHVTNDGNIDTVSAGQIKADGNIYGSQLYSGGTRIADSSGQIRAGVINATDVDFIVTDTSDATTNIIWRDHSASKLYLGTSAAHVEFRSDITVGSGLQAFFDGGAAAANPAITFGTDTDTGIIRPTTNTLGFVTGGTERARINSSGHLDINGNNLIDVNQINGVDSSGWLDFNMDTDNVYPQTTSDNQTVLGSITHMNFVGDSNGNGTGGRFYWGYGVSNTDSGTFTKTMDLDRSGNLTLTGALQGPATFTIDPAAVGDNTGTVVIAGNLQVDGTTTTINSTTLTVDDKNITLASGSTNAAAANGAGITVDCGSDTDATFTYASTTDRWSFNKPTRVSGLTNAGISFTSTESLTHGSSSLPNGRIFYHSSRLIYDSPSSGHRFAVAGNQGTNIAMSISSGQNVGIGLGTADAVAKFQVEVAGIDTTTTSTTATTQVAIDTMAAATFRSAKYTIQVTNSTDSTYHLTEILLIHDGTTPGITEYGTVFTGSAAEATFDADISSGNVRLLATPASTDSMTFKVVRHCITV